MFRPSQKRQELYMDHDAQGTEKKGSGDIPRATWPATILTLGVGVIPVAWLMLESASPGVIGLGSAAWLLAVILKIPLATALRFYCRRHELGKYERAVVVGLFSGLSELGLSVVCFASLLGPLDVTDIVAFGVGASSTEVCLVMILALSQKSEPESERAWVAGARESLVVRYMQPLERFLAMGLHVASRGLVYFALLDRSYLLGIFPFVCFSAVDGVACYGHNSDWNWFTPTVARSFYGFIGLLVVVQGLLLIFALVTGDSVQL
jgi:hypothetical protein